MARTPYGWIRRRYLPSREHPQAWSWSWPPLRVTSTWTLRERDLEQLRPIPLTQQVQIE